MVATKTKTGIATYRKKSRTLKVEAQYIFLDGSLIGEIKYDKEDTKYFSVWIQIDGAKAYETDLKRKSAIGRALARVGIETKQYPAKAPRCDTKPQGIKQEGHTITVDSIIKSPISGYDAFITTKRGKRYYINWATEPTEEDVIKAWREDRKWFNHIN